MHRYAIMLLSRPQQLICHQRSPSSVSPRSCWRFLSTTSSSLGIGPLPIPLKGIFLQHNSRKRPLNPSPPFSPAWTNYTKCKCILIETCFICTPIILKKLCNYRYIYIYTYQFLHSRLPVRNCYVISISKANSNFLQATFERRNCLNKTSFRCIPRGRDPLFVLEGQGDDSLSSTKQKNF